MKMKRGNSFDYFGFFNDMIDVGCRSSETLLEILKDFDNAKLEEYKERMHEVENGADKLKHKMTEHLMSEFLPPIDRADISTISNKLDDICDFTEDVVLYLYINDVKTCRPEAVQLCEVIIKMCGILKECLSDFRNFRKNAKLKRYIVSLKDMEEEGDRIYIRAMRKLMTDGSDLTEVIAWREIFLRLEDCCDAIEDVADSLEEVILKNS